MRSVSPAMSMPESASAWRAAATIICAKRSIFRALRLSIQSVGSKSFSSQANFTGKSDASKSVIGPAPLSPAQRLFQKLSGSGPSGVTAPSPVTTTLRVLYSLPVTHIPSPPSTSMISPVMNDASSEQRNRTAVATSWGVPSRPSGVFERRNSRISSERTPVSSVSM